MHPSVRLSVPRLERLDDPIVIAAFRGWHDGTGSAVGAIRYLRSEWGAREVADMDPDRYYDLTVARPHVQLRGEERLIRWPGTRFYVAPHLDGARDVVLLAGREPSLAWRSYCDAISEVIGELGAKTFIALGSRPALVPHTRPALLGLADADPGFEALFGLEANRAGYQGPTGIQTVLGLQLRAQGVRTARLTVRIPSYVTAGPNPMAALALVEKLDLATRRRTPLDALHRSVADFQRQTEAALDQLDTPRQMRGQIVDMERAYDEAAPTPIPASREQELPSTESLIGDVEELLRQQRRGPENSER
ncbi:MAG: PAC2 family protein [Dehalococcoidia bacterium]|nr:PAC2 family protein [Dehalococcoidia bacterium]